LLYFGSQVYTDYDYQQWRNSRFEPGGENFPVAERGLLANTQEKNLRNDVQSGCGWLYWNPKSPENTLETKNNVLLKTKRILKPKYRLIVGFIFAFSLPCQTLAICPSVPVSYAT